MPEEKYSEERNVVWEKTKPWREEGYILWEKKPWEVFYSMCVLWLLRETEIWCGEKHENTKKERNEMKLKARPERNGHRALPHHANIEEMKKKVMCWKYESGVGEEGWYKILYLKLRLKKLKETERKTIWRRKSKSVITKPAPEIPKRRLGEEEEHDRNSSFSGLENLKPERRRNWLFRSGICREASSKKENISNQKKKLRSLTVTLHIRQPKLKLWKPRQL